jgi:hypothetical protein
MYFGHASSKIILPLRMWRLISHYINQEKTSLPENHCLMSLLQKLRKLLELLILGLIQMKIESLEFLQSKHSGFCQQHSISLQTRRTIYTLFYASESLIMDTALCLNVWRASNLILYNELQLIFSFLIITGSRTHTIPLPYVLHVLPVLSSSV